MFRPGMESAAVVESPEEAKLATLEEEESGARGIENEAAVSVKQEPGSVDEEEEMRLETQAQWERYSRSDNMDTRQGYEQSQLKSHVITGDTEEWQRNPGFPGLQRVGGVDLSFIKGDDVNACASLVVLSYPGLEVLLVDGNGILHHRGFGFACHLGVLTGLPCVGVAKNLLQVDGLENNDRHKEQIRELQRGGDRFCLTGSTGNVLGMALRSCDKSAKPIYVSVGHKISLESAVLLVGSCCKYRTPEPIRQADIRSREYIRKNFPEHVKTEGQPA
ncbi:endonuclease V isoform X3 [Pleurodeles waltl]|uniref:endonuclease V isoform X3 n=1 Tax=Pleurodeles waltl TaxID=8319 RepID=UPI003709A9BE